MKLIRNEKLDAIEFLESDKCNGLTLYLDSHVKTALIPGNDYIHAESITGLVKILKKLDKINANTD